MTRIAALIAALLMVAAPVVAANPEQAPAGTVLVIVAVSDGTTYLPYGQAVVPPTACLP